MTPVSAELVGWLDERLAAAGRRRTGEVEVPRERPWGTVLRTDTDAGGVWLKMPAPTTAFEVELYPVLHRLAPHQVLAPIAADPPLGRLLLPDGGPALRDAFTGDELDEALIKILPRYAELQRSLMPAVDELLDIGVADMRPAVLPERFEEALEAASIAGDVRAVHARRSWFADVAAALADSRVPPSLDHADLHPGNIFADGGRFFDWGDSVVAHPFASMLVTLRGATDDRLRDAYLEPFTDLAPRQELLADLRNAMIAGNVIRALTWHRAVVIAGYEHAGAFATGPATHMNQLLAAAPWTCP
ncbi:aminoglycoside phosphotransferase family protein [Dactylosporangium darangshiense]|uniref:Phosphotransferase n=1 Tax=Dactylosporangium darangshiense TaxID=579108 RepID=A0ABP8DRD7_9ACTN